ncbi:CG33339 [Drosophila busckii]|uniref:CG33339 n=2 Tax=Drosophila busckii TaxID=30019 RepID=A0A0M4EQJ9_DROBS|nr:CG33339 [Drosophila busckii]
MYVPLPDTVEGWRPNILLGPTTKKPRPARRRWQGDWQQNFNAYNGTHYSSYGNRRVDYAEPGPYQAANYAKHAKPKHNFYKSPWQLTEEHWPHYAQQQQQQHEHYNSWQQVPKWKLHRGYRERREIFDQLESMGHFLQMDFRSCIKRAMCELRAKFNERHHNGLLMEDLLRMMLTVPTEVDDEKYQHSWDVQDCARFYAVSCPYGIVEFLSQSVHKMKSE